jgi:hypothetical protein
LRTPKASSKRENRKLILTPKEVRVLVEHAPTLRDRAVILFMFQGGFDISTICSLNYGDVARELSEERSPMMISVVRAKEEVEYFTFVGREAVDALKAHLNERRSKGEEIRLDTPLFVKEGAKKRKSERIGPNLIQKMLREVAARSGMVSEEEMNKADVNPCRPHALRSAFSTILRLNGFDPLLVEFMMGHTIPYNGAYLIPPPKKVRDMYGGVEPQLSISSTSRDIGEIEKRVEDKIAILKGMVEELQTENARIAGDNKKFEEEVIKMEEKLREVVDIYNRFMSDPAFYGVLIELTKEVFSELVKVFVESFELNTDFKGLDLKINADAIVEKIRKKVFIR